MPIGHPSLDQLRVLVAVADAGSFSAAARQLGRAQSVVSYTVANLEAQLGLALFERGRRRPELTQAGRALLEDARRVGLAVDRLRARAGGLTRGLEPELSLAMDVMFPNDWLVAALEDFAAAFPTVGLRLHVEPLGAAAQLVLDGRCTIGVAGWMAGDQPRLERREIAGTDMLPVAAPGHPLAALPAPVPPEALREHLQLCLLYTSDAADEL